MFKALRVGPGLRVCGFLGLRELPGVPTTMMGRVFRSNQWPFGVKRIATFPCLCCYGSAPKPVARFVR